MHVIVCNRSKGTIRKIEEENIRRKILEESGRIAGTGITKGDGHIYHIEESK